MASDNLSRTMKIISTVTLGHLAGITSYKSSCLVPSLEEQSDITAAAKTMRSIMERSKFLPVLSVISSVSGFVVFYRSYGSVDEDKFYLVAPLITAGLLPYTAMALLPINDHFVAPGETFEGTDEKWRALLKEWKKWHLPRSVVCASLFSIAVYKLVF